MRYDIFDKVQGTLHNTYNRPFQFELVNFMSGSPRDYITPDYFSRLSCDFFSSNTLANSIVNITCGFF